MCGNLQCRFACPGVGQVRSEVNSNVLLERYRRDGPADHLALCLTIGHSAREAHWGQS